MLRAIIEYTPKTVRATLLVGCEHTSVWTATPPSAREFSTTCSACSLFERETAGVVYGC